MADTKQLIFSCRNHMLLENNKSLLYFANICDLGGN